MAVESPSPTKPTSLMRKHLDNKSVQCEYKDVFEGIGLFPGECDIRTDKNATSVVIASRRISFALREKLQIGLKSMSTKKPCKKCREQGSLINFIFCV